jgi:2-polyprenyl-3-methyl-5-hydroxy-6-metoxy-1,4-benzoquinol methylase
MSAAGTLRSKHVLDIGSGCGFLSYRLAQVARLVLGIDISREMIRESRKRFGTQPNLRFQRVAVEHFSVEKGRAFDVCTANMSLITVEKLPEALRVVRSVLRRNGRLIFSITHPCFWNAYRGDEPSESFDYWKPHRVVAPFRITLDRTPLPRSTSYFHRPLSLYIAAILKAQFQISDFVEPNAPSTAPDDYRISFKFPRFAIFVCTAI